MLVITVHCRWQGTGRDGAQLSDSVKHGAALGIGRDGSGLHPAGCQRLTIAALNDRIARKTERFFAAQPDSGLPLLSAWAP